MVPQPHLPMPGESPDGADAADRKSDRSSTPKTAAEFKSAMTRELGKYLATRIAGELRFSQDALIGTLGSSAKNYGGICAALAALYMHLRRNRFTREDAILSLMVDEELVTAAYKAYQTFHAEAEKGAGRQIGDGANRIAAAQQLVNGRIYRLFAAISGNELTPFLPLRLKREKRPFSTLPSELTFCGNYDLQEHKIAARARIFLENGGKDFQKSGLIFKKTVSYAQHCQKILSLLPAAPENGSCQLLYLRLESPADRFAHAVSVDREGANDGAIFDPNCGVMTTSQGLNAQNCGSLLSQLFAIYRVRFISVYVNKAKPVALPPVLERKASPTKT